MFTRGVLRSVAVKCRRGVGKEHERCQWGGARRQEVAREASHGAFTHTRRRKIMSRRRRDGERRQRQGECLRRAPWRGVPGTAKGERTATVAVQCLSQRQQALNATVVAKLSRAAVAVVGLSNTAHSSPGGGSHVRHYTREFWKQRSFQSALCARPFTYPGDERHAMRIAR